MMKLKQKLNHHIIGQSKAIEQIINQLKLTKQSKQPSAVMLFVGNSGVGKSFFVQTLFHHLKETKRISSDIKLSKINCKYFMNHENDLDKIFLKDNEFLKQLKNGMLFVDNIHLISQDKRSIIYDFITLQSKENFI